MDSQQKMQAETRRAVEWAKRHTGAMTRDELKALIRHGMEIANGQNVQKPARGARRQHAH